MMSFLTSLAGWACLGVLIVLRIQATNAGCSRPTEDIIEHGFLRKQDNTRENFNENQYIKVYCKMGSHTWIRCSAGTWIKTGVNGRPRCDIAPRCRHPPVYNYTNLEIEGQNLGNKVTYTCKRGFVPVKEGLTTTAQKTCRQKGKCKERDRAPCSFGWSNLRKTFHCAVPSGGVICPLPDDPNRVINQEESEIGVRDGVYRPGDYLVLECAAGFYMHFSDIECMEDGTWGPGNVETTCHRIECTVPELPSNVRVDDQQEVYYYSERMRVICQLEDHVFRGHQSATLEIPCSDSGRWKSRVPACEKIKCPYIENLENGEILEQLSTSYVGDSVSVNCLDGQLEGPTTRWCTKYGTWNGTLQVCVTNHGESDCKNPGTPIGGSKMGESYNIGDVVTFTCNHGRILLGSQRIICQKNKEWTDRVPICRGKGEFLSAEEAANGLKDFVGKKAEDTSSSDQTQQMLLKYRGKDVFIGNIDMKYYNPDSRTPLETLGKDGLDLFLLFDTSGSISQDDFKVAIDLAKNVVQKLGVSRDKTGTTVTLAAFNTTVWRLRLSQPENTVASILHELDELGKIPPTGSTSLQAAMETLNGAMLPHNTSSTGVRRKAPYAVLLFSDGVYNTGQDPKEIVETIKKQYERPLEFFCIGVGNVDVELLTNIATSNSSEHLIFMRDYSVLSALDVLFTAHEDFSRCGEFRKYKDIFNNSISADKKFWPWMAALYHTPNDPDANLRSQLENSEHMCGASIIGETGRARSPWLLTAAHCFLNRNNYAKFIVKIGSYSSRVDDGTGLLFSIDTVITHAGFIGEHLENDIALIKLKEEVEFVSNIRPVCLPEQNQTDGYELGRQGEVTGWGGEDVGSLAVDHLKTIEVKVADITQCKRNLTTLGVVSKVNDTWNFCAGNVLDRDDADHVQDSCAGDSGGPLVTHTRDKIGEFRFTQTGIVSFGEDSCGKTHHVPGVYTNVAKFVTWIKENAKFP